MVNRETYGECLRLFYISELTNIHNITTMMQLFEKLGNPFRRFAGLFLLMTVVIPSYSQELTIVATQTYHLHDCTPNPYFSRGYYTSKERGDIVNVGDTITIYAFHKSMDWTFIYNQKKAGYISGIKALDKQLYKQIKKAKVWDYHENSNEIKIKEREIFSSITSYYNHLADAFDREMFVKDSLEKRNKFIADSIQKREKYVRDSLAKVEKHRQDSIKWVEQQEQIELNKRIEIETYKYMDPFLMDVTSWFVDNEITMSLNIRFVNCSNKIAKYVTFKGRFLNRVHDPVRELWKGGYTWSATGIGPMYPAPRSIEEYENPQGKYEGKIGFTNLYYFYPRNAVSYIEVTSVTIEYMDGTKRTITGNELKKRVMYSCH